MTYVPDIVITILDALLNATTTNSAHSNLPTVLPPVDPLSQLHTPDEEEQYQELGKL